MPLCLPRCFLPDPSLERLCPDSDLLTVHFPVDEIDKSLDIGLVRLLLNKEVAHVQASDVEKVLVLILEQAAQPAAA